MTAFRQGPTPWYRVEDGARFMARGIDRESMETAMRWAERREQQQAMTDEPAEFVRDAIQRSYQ